MPASKATRTPVSAAWAACRMRCRGELTHLSSRAYRRYLPDTKATAVILRAGRSGAVSDACAGRRAIPTSRSRDSRVLFVHDDVPPRAAFIASAFVDPTAQIWATGVSVGPNAVVGARCTIGNRVVIGANCVIGDECALGDDTRLMASVTLYRRVRIGARGVVHSGAVIGADGFGFAPDERGRQQEIAQVGGVVLGDDVSVGAATTIDRGAIDDTVVGDWREDRQPGSDRTQLRRSAITPSSAAVSESSAARASGATVFSPAASASVATDRSRSSIA